MKSPLPQVLRECYKRDRDYQFWKGLRRGIMKIHGRLVQGLF